MVDKSYPLVDRQSKTPIYVNITRSQIAEPLLARCGTISCNLARFAPLDAISTSQLGIHENCAIGATRMTPRQQ